MILQFFRAFLTALSLVIAFSLSGCTQVKEQLGQEEKDEFSETLPLLALTAATLPVNPGSCSFTFGSASVMIQEYNLTSNQSSTFPSGFTYSFRNWAAVKIPAATAATTVAFSYSPFYPSSTYGSIYLVYNETACPLNNSSAADFNRTVDLSASRTPTYYTVSGNTFSFNGAAAGRSFIIVSAGAPGSSPQVTRTN